MLGNHLRLWVLVALRSAWLPTCWNAGSVALQQVVGWRASRTIWKMQRMRGPTSVRIERKKEKVKDRVDGGVNFLCWRIVTKPMTVFFIFVTFEVILEGMENIVLALRICLIHHVILLSSVWMCEQMAYQTESLFIIGSCIKSSSYQPIIMWRWDVYSLQCFFCHFGNESYFASHIFLSAHRIVLFPSFHQLLYMVD